MCTHKKKNYYTRGLRGKRKGRTEITTIIIIMRRRRKEVKWRNCKMKRNLSFSLAQKRFIISLEQ